MAAAIYELLFLIWTTFGIQVVGGQSGEEEGGGEGGIVVNLENFLQISAQNQQMKEILSRQKRHNGVELEMATATMPMPMLPPPLTQAITPPLLEDGNEIGLELVGNPWRVKNDDDAADDDELLTLMWRNDWIWRETGGGSDGANVTENGGRKENGTGKEEEGIIGQATTIPVVMNTTTMAPRRRIRKKGSGQRSTMVAQSTATMWPLAWINIPAAFDPTTQQQQQPMATISPRPSLLSSSTSSSFLLSTSSSFSSTIQTRSFPSNSSTTASRTILCCPHGGLWGNWTSVGQCDGKCGGCGQQLFRRECLSSVWGCPCLGESSARRECALAPCPFPRLSCCNGQKIQQNGRQTLCGHPPAPPVNSPLPECLSCPSGGVWSEWRPEGECSDSCGSCGSQSYGRECISAKWGCACSGPVSLKLVCNQRPCAFPRLSCCNRLKVKAGTNRTLICGQQVSPSTIIEN